jgi:uncharacterized protein
MADYSRRGFAQMVTASSLLGQAGAVLHAQQDKVPTRRLGKINIQAGILGLGSQHLGDPDATQANADRVIAEGLEHGVNYIDTAPTYNRSEERVGRALKGKRDKVFLVSKIETITRGDVMYQLKDSLHKLQTDYLDAVHIHNIGREDRFPSMTQTLSKDGPLGALLDARKQGMIRHIGVTAHMRPARAIPAFETGEIELFMCTTNFVERHVYNFEEKVLPEARKRNIAVIGMKVLGGPVKGGARLMAPEDYQATLRYAWSLPGLSVAIIGMRTPEELRQAVAAAKAFKPLEPRELSSLAEKGRTLATQWGPLRGPVA